MAKIQPKLYGDWTNVAGTCGLGVAYRFSQNKREIENWYDNNQLRVPPGGTGFFVAGFIDEPPSKAAYEFFCRKARLVYQSPVRVNANSRNRFFFCIFDRDLNG